MVGKYYKELSWDIGNLYVINFESAQNALTMGAIEKPNVWENLDTNAHSLKCIQLVKLF